MCPHPHFTMRNGCISEERPLCSPASTLHINTALAGSRWGFAELSPALKELCAVLLERHISLSDSWEAQLICNRTIK